MKGLIYRALEVGDAESINRIHAAITNNEELSDISQHVVEQISNAGDISFVAEIEGRVVGYMISHLIFGGFGIKECAWITMMGVDPEYMGQGIGLGLAEEIFKAHKARNVKQIYSSVEWDSTDLLSFFKGLGFERSSFINLKKQL